MNIREHNRRAWDKNVADGNQWTVPVKPEIIVAARRGEWDVFLTPIKTVPRDWLLGIAGKKVLCLASGGGQQGPILAAAGAHVTVFDNSPKQLEQDRFVAKRDELSIETVEGDMADLHVFPDETFDFILNPVSNVFIPDVRPMWREAFRVLRKDGVLITGFGNPAQYLFDFPLAERTGKLRVKHKLPYSDVESLSNDEKRRFVEEGIPFEFSHTLDDQIGGQIAAGFVITGFYEDNNREDDSGPLRLYMPVYIVTRAAKAVI